MQISSCFLLKILQQDSPSHSKVDQYSPTTSCSSRHYCTQKILFVFGSQEKYCAILLVYIKISDLEDKIVGIYFSANWYPQCQTFTKLLIQVYDEIQAKKDSKFEIIFVSSDEDLNAFNNFYQSYMPWLAIPFSDLETKKALNKRYDVEGIPCLVILQPHDDASVLHDGVELIYRYGVDVYPFTNERLDELLRQEKEKHERQTLVNLLTNHDRDFVLAHSASKQVSVSRDTCCGSSSYNLTHEYCMHDMNL
ncbi:putative protein-disulfide reductase [Helianthus anomalus]